MRRTPQRSTLFPYTTLFRSLLEVRTAQDADALMSVAMNHAVPVFGPDEREPMIADASTDRSEEHTSELQSQFHLVCRLLLEKKKDNAETLNLLEDRLYA